MELNCIIKTGTYVFHLGGMEEMLNFGDKSQMLLEFEQDSAGVSVGSHSSYYHGKEPAMLRLAQKEKLNLEQIRDFVRKLGFVDREKQENQHRITDFVHLNQVKLMFLTDSAIQKKCIINILFPLHFSFLLC